MVDNLKHSGVATPLVTRSSWGDATGDTSTWANIIQDLILNFDIKIFNESDLWFASAIETGDRDRR